MKKLKAFALVPLMASMGNVSADPEVSLYAGAPGWKESKEERIEWFKDAKFGMFIHWGLYSPAGGYWPPGPENGQKYNQHYAEWIRHWSGAQEPEYGNLTKPLFKPEPNCTDEWAKVAKDAGMKYAVLTTKHHEGYTLFNARAPYSVKNDFTGYTNISPEGRDMVAEYSESMREQDIKVGYYYSIIDWQHPDAYPLSRPWPLGPNPDHKRYVEYMHDHLDQLFTDYGKVDLLWPDYSSARFQGSTWRTKELLNKLREKQPHLVINNRFWNDLHNAYGDYFTPEKYVPPTGYPGRVFEVCHTMNESFGYSYHDNNWKTTEQTIELLVDIVSKGGNLLLNVGPDAQGRIPEESTTVLRETGKWLEVYGDAIYGTEASPFARLAFDGRCTQKTVEGGDTDLYIHLFSWPEDNKIALPVLENEIVGASMMASKTKLKSELTDEGYVIELPESGEHEICDVVVLRIKGKPEVNELLSMPQQKADRSVVIEAGFMELQGQGGIKFQGDNPQHVSHWLNPSDYVEASVNITTPGKVQPGGEVTREPGRYEVWFHYAADPSGAGDLKIETVDNQVIETTLKTTGGWQSYQDVKVGEITLKDTGATTLTLKATKINPAGFINLAKVELKPID